MPFTPSAALAVCLSLCALASGGGCAKPRPAERMQMARVRFENHTDLPWRITLTAGPAREARVGEPGKALHLSPREIRVLEVGAGAYRVRAMPEEAQGTMDTWALASEGEDVKLSAGGNYVWPLSTLLSDGEAAL
jgi:hypothetical protein